MNDLFNDTVHQEPVYGFEDFWAKVPNKVAKKAAEKAWRKLKSQDRQLAADRVTAFYAWFAKTYPKASMLHPATYLNGERWNDIEAPKATDNTAAIRKALQSPIASVREHAQRMADRMGVSVE